MAESYIYRLFDTRTGLWALEAENDRPQWTDNKDEAKLFSYMDIMSYPLSSEERLYVDVRAERVETKDRPKLRINPDVAKRALDALRGKETDDA